VRPQLKVIPMKLRSVTIANFRSVGGSITVPLDAPIVLIHGPNGAGKTTILSAIELALTGSIDSLKALDPDYVRHLVNVGADEALVTLSSQADTTSDIVTKSVRMRTGHEIEGSPVLEPAVGRIFKERSYLAQSVLSKLFDVYLNDATETSPLLAFVNDLLGLASLDALIEGLFSPDRSREFGGAA